MIIRRPVLSVGCAKKRRVAESNPQMTDVLDGIDQSPTPREVEIIRLLTEGKANKEIASELAITVRTVEAHRSRLMHKLGMHSLAELIHYAMDNGISPARESR